MTDGLVAFLTARLDEDEQAANAATHGPWGVNSETYPETIYGPMGETVIAGSRWGGEANVFDIDEDAVHIVRHHPARVLADVAAKRRIIDEHRPWSEAPGFGWPDPACAVCVSMVMDEDQGGNRFLDLEHVAWPCPTLRLLALPFADHPGYRDEWRPA